MTLRRCRDSISEAELSSSDPLFNIQGITQGIIWWYGTPWYSMFVPCPLFGVLGVFKHP